MSRKDRLVDPALAIGFVVLALAGIIGVGQFVAVHAFQGAQVTVVNAPIASTNDDVAITIQAENSPYGHGYGQDDYMASPTLTGADSVNWYFGEGEAVPAD